MQMKSSKYANEEYQICKWKKGTKISKSGSFRLLQNAALLQENFERDGGLEENIERGGGLEAGDSKGDLGSSWEIAAMTLWGLALWFATKVFLHDNWGKLRLLQREWEQFMCNTYW